MSKESENYWGAWLAPLMEHATLELRVVSSSPTLSGDCLKLKP